ncbi:MAG: Bax inhibitor-1/YccA family protein [Treponema sp.]|nr:Bax inhibitor-1/YccA family protein [Treponema sp.]
MNTYDSVKSTSVSEQNKFLAKVYGWMTFALLLSALTAYGTAVYAANNIQAFAAFFRGGFFVAAIAELVIVFYLSARINKISAAKATTAFIIYSILNGFNLSTIFFAYNIASIANIFAISAGMFLCMAIYGSKTKSDLMSYRKFFSMAILGILIATLVNFLLRSSGMSLVISIAAVVLFTGLTAYDAQKMLIISRQARDDEMFKKASIIGALELYLDFINIFLHLLRIFGNRK